jgi:prepilin-type N-terminal cleavage/methylation domain-containing protein
MLRRSHQPINLPPHKKTVLDISGFTLVELLVVIGIIALLIAILLPVLGKARVAARRVSCLSNLHQLAVAMQTYLAQNKGVFPGHKDNLTTNPPTPYWADFILGDDTTGQTKYSTLLDCPAMGTDTSGEYGHVWTFANNANDISYGYNAFFLGHAPYSDGTAGTNFVQPEYGYYTPIPPLNGIRMNQVKHPSECLLFADHGPPYGLSLWWPNASMAPGQGNEGVYCQRHKGVGMVVFVDSHGEMRTDKQINPPIDPNGNYSALALENSKWWDPMQRNLTVP